MKNHEDQFNNLKNLFRDCINEFVIYRMSGFPERHKFRGEACIDQMEIIFDKMEHLNEKYNLHLDVDIEDCNLDLLRFKDEYNASLNNQREEC